MRSLGFNTAGLDAAIHVIMSTERTNHEKTRAALTRELETVLKASLCSPYATKEFISSEITQTVCNVIEAIFIHGLKDPFFLKGSRYAKYPEPNFWPFVSKYSHRSITTQIAALKQIRTEIGRSRAWIRIVLNEGSLEHYIHLLLNEKRALGQFYNEHAYLRDPEHIERMNGFVKGLSGIPIQAATNSSFLNSWTPSPLILAGLVLGKAIKVGSLRPIRKSAVPRDSDEVGISALDLLPVPVKLSPIRRTPRSRHVSVNAASDDDASSVYSHPSMLDRSEQPSRMFSSTPNQEGPLAEAIRQQHSANIAPLLVSRRTRRPRRSSRSSSESNSKGSVSRDQSEVASTAGGFPDSSLPEVRMKQSETLDSGIEAEHREPFTESLGSLPEQDSALCLETAAVAASESKHVGESNSQASDDSGHMDDESLTGQKAKRPSTEDDVFVNSEEADLSVSSPDDQMVKDADEVVFSTGEVNEVEVPSAEVSNVLSPQSELDSSSVETQNEAQGAIPILHKNEQLDESCPAGTSLHDELMLSSLSVSGTVPVTGNTLMGGGWAIPRSSWEGDGDTSGMLSSSSGTDSSGMVVSFGQALRTAMEQSPTVESREFVEGDPVTTLDSTDCSRKSSVQPAEDVDQKLTTIPREIGLVEQEHRCPMCRKSIGLPFGFAKYGVCGVDGLYYCVDCHRAGGVYTVPSRVLHSWDWTQREVSDRGRAFIEANLDKAVFDIDSLNPTLYEHVPTLDQIRKLRERLQLVSMYLFTCRESIAEDFRKRIWPREYLHNDIHKYSFMDLQNVRNGHLEKQLNGWLKHAIGHVMACTLCKQKGFVCEVCPKQDVIYPFNTSLTHRCADCHSLFHKECAMAECPKCSRRAKYETRQEATDLPLNC